MINTLFSTINISDLSREKYQLQKEKYIELDARYTDKEISDLFENMDALFKIAEYKFSISDSLNEESLRDIIENLEMNYYDKEALVKKVDKVLRILFIPLYYKNDDKYMPNIPQEFWNSSWGKIIITCLCDTEDILLSATEVAELLNYKRQNINLLVKNNKIPFKKVGGNYIFKLSDVLSYKKIKRTSKAEV